MHPYLVMTHICIYKMTLPDTPGFEPVCDNLYKALFLLQRYLINNPAKEDPIVDCSLELFGYLYTVLLHIDEDTLCGENPLQMARLYLNVDRANRFRGGAETWSGYEEGFSLLECGGIDLSFPRWVELTSLYPGDLREYFKSDIGEIFRQLIYHNVSKKRMSLLTTKEKESALELIEEFRKEMGMNLVVCSDDAQNARLYLTIARLKSYFYIPSAENEPGLRLSDFYEKAFNWGYSVNVSPLSFSKG